MDSASKSCKLSDASNLAVNSLTGSKKNQSKSPPSTRCILTVRPIASACAKNAVRTVFWVTASKSRLDRRTSVSNSSRPSLLMRPRCTSFCNADTASTTLARFGRLSIATGWTAMIGRANVQNAAGHVYPYNATLGLSRLTANIDTPSGYVLAWLGLCDSQNEHTL